MGFDIGRGYIQRRVSAVSRKKSEDLKTRGKRGRKREAFPVNSAITGGWQIGGGGG